MKKVMLFALIVLGSLPAMAQKKKKEKGGHEEEKKEHAVMSHTDSLSYAFGLSIYENAQSAGFTQLNYDLIVRAMKDASENKTTLDKEKAVGLVNAEVRKNQQAKNEASKKVGEEWLKKNASQPGVVQTASGLQYKVVQEGTGANPDKNDKVTVHYHGTLTDGTVFDSSVDRKQPATFGLNQVIPGWTEGLQYMKEGAKYTFYIPQNLAYGARAQGKIPAFSTLIFEVELIKVEKVD